MKNILLQLQDEPRWKATLEDAIAVARAAAAHLDVVVVVPFGLGLTLDSFGDVLVNEALVRDIRQRSLAIESAVAGRLDREGISATVELLDGAREAVVADRAPLHDLIVVNRHSHALSSRPSAVPYLAAVLHGTRAPLLVCADGERAIDPCGTALVAWNGSAEAAFAIRQALPLLKLADTVRVLRIEEPDDDGPAPNFPDTTVMDYLSRHAIHGELEIERGADLDPQSAIVARAGALGAYVVMGGYARSRLGAFLFGGTTRRILEACPVPVVLAH